MGILIFRTWLPAWSCCWWIKSLQWELNIENDDDIISIASTPPARMPVIHQDDPRIHPTVFPRGFTGPLKRVTAGKPLKMEGFFVSGMIGWTFYGAVSPESHGTKSGGEFPPIWKSIFRSDSDLFSPQKGGSDTSSGTWGDVVYPFTTSLGMGMISVNPWGRNWKKPLTCWSKTRPTVFVWWHHHRATGRCGFSRHKGSWWVREQNKPEGVGRWMREKKGQKKLSFSMCVYIHIYIYSAYVLRIYTNELPKSLVAGVDPWYWSSKFPVKRTSKGSLFKSGDPFFGEGNFPY